MSLNSSLSAESAAKQTWLMSSHLDKAKKNSTSGITSDLFLAKTAHGLDFVPKKSRRGRILVLKSTKGTGYIKQGSPLDFTQNYQEVKSILEKAKQVNEEEFSKINLGETSGEGITYQVFQQKIKELETCLNQISLHLHLKQIAVGQPKSNKPSALKQDKKSQNEKTTQKRPLDYPTPVSIRSKAGFASIKAKRIKVKKEGRFYASTSQEMIYRAVDLMRSFEEERAKNQSCRISDFFLVKMDDGSLRFLRKKSLSGRWAAFKAVIAAKLGKKESQLNITENLSAAAKVVAEASKGDQKFFEQLALNLSEGQQEKVQADELQGMVKGLADVLNNIAARVEERRKLKGLQNLEPRVLTSQAALKPVQQAFEEIAESRAKASEILAQLFKDVPEEAMPSEEKEEVKKAVSDLIFSHPQGPHILSSLSNNEINLLRQAILEGICRAPEERAERLLTALRHLPISPAPDQPTLPKIEIQPIAQVFGDSFLRQSGFESGLKISKMAKFVTEFIDAHHLSTPLADNIKHNLSSAIELQNQDLTGRQLRTMLKKQLEMQKGKGAKKCLMIGGWQNHEILYEIEKQPNGRYTFRLFNRKPGEKQQAMLVNRYGVEAKTGYVEFCNIRSKDLFRSSFLTSLISLTTTDENRNAAGIHPQDMLLYHILPTLRGTKTAVDPAIQTMLSVQQAKTNVYASLEAWLADQMKSEQFTLFSCQFKSHLLARHLPEIESLLSQNIDADKFYYKTLREEHQILKGSLENFSNWVDLHQASLPDEEIDKAKSLLIRAQAALSSIRLKMNQVETSMSSAHGLPGQISCMPVEAIRGFCITPIEETGPRQADAKLLSQEVFETLQKIDALNLSDQGFSKDLEDCLNDLWGSHLELNQQQYQLLCDHLLKKMGSLSAWHQVQFSKPEEATKGMMKVIKKLAEKINAENLYLYKGESYLRILAFSRAYEEAFFQIEINNRVIDKTASCYPFISSLPAVQKGIEQLYCSDPFWGDMQTELLQLGQTQSSLSSSSFGNVRLYSHYSEISTSLPETLSNDITKWWLDENKKDFRDKVSTSIKEDRVKQKQEIESIIKDLKKEIEENKIEIEKIKTKMVEENRFYSSNSVNYSRLARDKFDLERQNEELERKITSTPEKIKNDARYWPRGFLEREDNRLLNNRERAVFLMAQFVGNKNFWQEKVGKNPLPSPFIDYCNFALLTNNLFFINPNDVVDYSYQAKYSLSVLKDNSFAGFNFLLCEKSFICSATKFNSDLYVDNIKNSGGQPLAKGYEAVKSYSKLEGSVSKTAFDAKNSGSQPPQQEALIQQGRPVPFCELKELLSLHCEKNAQIVTLFTYFLEKREKLGETAYFNIFHSLLFESDLLTRELLDDESAEKLIPIMRNFFETCMVHAENIDELRTSVNLLWAASNVQRFIDQASTKRLAEGKARLPDLIKTTNLTEMIDKVCDVKYANQWGEIGQTLLATSLLFFDRSEVRSGNRSLLGAVLFAATLVDRYPVNVRSECLPRQEQALAALTRLQQVITASFEKEQAGQLPSLTLDAITDAIGHELLSKLNRIYPNLGQPKLILNKEKKIWYNDDGSIQFSPTTGQLITKEDSLRIFSEPVEPFIFEFLVKEQICSKGDSANLLCYKDKNNTFIYDKKRNLELLILDFANFRF